MNDLIALAFQLSEHDVWDAILATALSIFAGIVVVAFWRMVDRRKRDRERLAKLERDLAEFVARETDEREAHKVRKGNSSGADHRS